MAVFPCAFLHDGSTMKIGKPRSGALFILAAGVDATQMASYLSWGAQLRLESDAVDFLQVIFDLCLSDDEGLADMRTIEARYGKSRSTILSRCQLLLQLGILHKEMVSIPGKRASSCYVVRHNRDVSVPPLPKAMVVSESVEACRSAVLLFDDEAGTEGCCALLRKAEYTVTLVATMEAFFTELSRRVYDVLLIRASYPAASVSELLREYREHLGRYPLAPVVVLADDFTADRKEEWLDLGVSQVLSPPSSDAQLLNAVSQAERDLSTQLLPLDASGPSRIKGELFSVFTLASALPSGKSGALTEKSYTCPIRSGNELVNLEIRPTAGTKVASVLDLRVLAAISTIIFKRLEQGAPAVNPFVLNFDELENVMQGGRQRDSSYKRSGSYKRYLLSSVDRWESTGFRIIKATSGFLKKYRKKIELKHTFRLIYKTKVLSYVGPKGKTPEKIALYIDDDFLNRIADVSVGYLLSVHDEVLNEKNPFALRVNLWCRRAIKHSHKPKVFDCEHLHSEIEPMRLVRKFRADLKAFYQAHFDSQRGHAHYLGYNFEQVNNGRRIRYYIWADPEDRLVGRCSFYAHSRSLNKVA